MGTQTGNMSKSVGVEIGNFRVEHGRTPKWTSKVELVFWLTSEVPMRVASGLS